MASAGPSVITPGVAWWTATCPGPRVTNAVVISAAAARAGVGLHGLLKPLPKGRTVAASADSLNRLVQRVLKFGSGQDRLRKCIPARLPALLSQGQLEEIRHDEPLDLAAHCRVKEQLAGVQIG